MPYKDREKAKEKNREYCKKYRILHADRLKISQKTWRKKARFSIKKYWRKKIVERDGAKCKRCGSVNNLTLQHKIPSSIGGKYNFENLEILCLKCNITDYHQLVKKALRFYFENHKN